MQRYNTDSKLLIFYIRLVRSGTLLTGRSWFFLAGSGWFWLVLAGSGWFWLVLAGHGRFWLVLAGPGRFWLQASCIWVSQLSDHHRMMA